MSQTTIPRIIIDMDGVLADTYFKFVDRYEERFGRRPPREELLGKKVYDLPGGADIRNGMYEEGFFRDVPIIAGAAEVVKELYANYEVFIVTHCTEFRNSFIDKYEWLEEHLPFVHYSRIVFCGDKSIVHGDYCIDDKVRNLRLIGGTGLLFNSWDNALDDGGFHRVDNWQEVRDYFRAEKRSIIAELG